jgi:hypothetical protein
MTSNPNYAHGTEPLPPYVPWSQITFRSLGETIQHYLRCSKQKPSRQITSFRDAFDLVRAQKENKKGSRLYRKFLWRSESPEWYVFSTDKVRGAFWLGWAVNKNNGVTFYYDEVGPDCP